MATTKKQKLEKANRLAHARREAAQFRSDLIEQMLKLATSGFGLVAALAWNDLIKELIQTYIRPLVGESAGIASMIIYALIVTILAVSVTYSLSKTKRKADKKAS